MKNNCKLLLWLVPLLLMAVACIGIKVRFVTDRSSRLAELEIQNMIQDRQIMELEKEVRILKTDMHILMYGFEGDNDD